MEQIETKIIEVENAHPRRPRCSRFGEMIQMDETMPFWAGEQKWTLHLAIDDATGIIVGAWFEEQETLRFVHAGISGACGRIYVNGYTKTDR